MKFYMFVAVGTQGFLWLAGLAIFNSLISLYYYLKMIREMYVKPSPHSTTTDMGHANISKPGVVITSLSVVLTLSIIYLGVYPFHLLKAIKAATMAIW